MDAWSVKNQDKETFIEIRGSGSLITAYEINNKILKQLKIATIEDALDEDNPISVVRELALRGSVISLGMYAEDDELTATIKIGNKVSPVKMGFLLKDGYASESNGIVGALHDGGRFTELPIGDRDNYLLAYSDDPQMLGKGFEIEKNSMFVVEIAEYKLGILSASINADLSEKPSDFELIVRDVDSMEVLSLATYGVGLVRGKGERDIFAIRYRDLIEEFEISILNGYASNYYLVKRNSKGVWNAEVLTAIGK